jgi:hypothetical protein
MEEIVQVSVPMLYKSEAMLACMDVTDAVKAPLWSDVAFYRRNASEAQADYERIQFDSQKFIFDSANNSLSIRDLRELIY